MATGGGETNRLSDETFVLLCSLCKHKNKNTEAAKFCVDCQDYYCSTCVKFHEDIPALSRHKILDIGHFQPGTSQMIQIVPTERCDRHSHKHVDMYCQNHDDVGCSTCMAVEHKHCRDTFYIPDFLQNNKGTTASKVINQKLETTEKLLKDQHTNFKQAKKRLLKSKDVCLEEIKEYRKDINQRLDVLEQNSVKAVDAKYKPKLDKLDEQMANNQKTKVKISSAKDNLLNEGNNESQMFVSTKKGKNVADNAIKFIAEIKEEIKGEDIKFITEPNLMSMLRELDLLGHLEEIDTWTQSKNECNNDSKTHQSTQSNSKKQAARATQNVVASYIETQSTDEHSNNSKTHQRSSKKQAASATQKAEESTTRLKSYDGYNNDSQKYQSTQSSIMQAVSATQKAEESATRLKSYDGYNNESQKYQSTQSKMQAVSATQKAEESATRLKSYDGYNNESQKYQSTQSRMQAVSATQKAEESATRLKSYDGYNNESQKYQSTQSKMQAVSAIQTVSNALMNVKNKKKYNIRISSDKKECYIYSACDLDDGTIILADNKNSKLKRVDSSTYTVTDYCDVSGNLIQVCKISNQEVAVSCGVSRYIQFVSLGSKMVPTKQIKTDHCVMV
ncbi:E3 ubiquitin-protein ligase TRIM33-like [Mercenaria mercenaria]|uniref:E3 ubiquitin-protein ligase TRIM33-like n=1 Tax=Mercenaria mercenaria TaxID=6596 RepID=UPI00234F9BF8|nr:E3 ubiquitin-protein ligase TRIM33-like [Mercenaria mercenaria]